MASLSLIRRDRSAHHSLSHASFDPTLLHCPPPLVWLLPLLDLGLMLVRFPRPLLLRCLGDGFYAGLGIGQLWGTRRIRRLLLPHGENRHRDLSRILLTRGPQIADDDLLDSPNLPLVWLLLY